MPSKLSESGELDEIAYKNKSKKVINSVLSDGEAFGETESEKNHYLLTVGESLPEGTSLRGQEDGVDMRVLRLHPFCFEMGSYGYLNFYDTAGEMWEGDDDTHKGLRGAVTGSDCIFAIINGEKDKLEESLKKFKTCTEALRRDIGVKGKIKTPIAIILTKFDKLFDETNPDGYMNRRNVLSWLDEKKLVYNSTLRRNVDFSSGEIEKYLTKTDDDGYLPEIIGNYANYKFFNVSALGSEDFIKVETKDRKKTKKLLTKPLPVRMELPIIWAMYQNGLIK
jgi:hypothetical protein